MKAAGPLRFESLLPEPARFWIRHAPVVWPGPGGWWVDLAHAALAAERWQSESVPALGRPRFDDLVYLPPLDRAAEFLRRELVDLCSDLGVPVLQQILPGAPLPVGDGPIVVDLTECLLRKRVATVEIAAGSWAAWPLIPGLTDSEHDRRQGLEVVAAAGAAGVAPVVPELTPAVRRQLAQFAPAAAYSSLFHGHEDALEGDFAREVAAHGLEVLPSQPPLGERRQTTNRELMAHFMLLAELWLRCRRPEGKAQVFFRTARRLQAEPVDVAELSRRGALSSVDWLDDISHEEVRRLASGLPSNLRVELEADYLNRASNGVADG